MAYKITIGSEEDIQKSVNLPDILFFLGLFSEEMKSSVISQQNFNEIVFNNRIAIEAITRSFYHEYHRGKEDKLWLKDELIALIDLIRHYAHGAYSRKELRKIYDELMTSVSEIASRSVKPAWSSMSDLNTPLVPHPKVKTIIRILNYFRALLTRSDHALFNLTAMPDLSLVRMHHKLAILSGPLMMASWTLPSARLLYNTHNVFSYTAGLEFDSKVLQYFLGCKLTSAEKELGWNLRVWDKLKRYAPQLIYDGVWAPARFACWLWFSTFAVAITLGLFIFGLARTLALAKMEPQFLDDAIKVCEEDALNPNLKIALSAFSKSKNELTHQNNLQISVWTTYVVGALLCVTGKDFIQDKEGWLSSTLLILGGAMIFLNCIHQVFRDASKLEIAKLKREKVENESESCSPADVLTSVTSRVMITQSNFHHQGQYALNNEARDSGKVFNTLEEVVPVNSQRLFGPGRSSFSQLVRGSFDNLLKGPSRSASVLDP